MLIREKTGVKTDFKIGCAKNAGNKYIINFDGREKQIERLALYKNIRNKYIIDFGREEGNECVSVKHISRWINKARYAINLYSNFYSNICRFII